MRIEAGAGLFLDRDGVINFDKGYVHTEEDFDFMPGIFEIARAAKAIGQKIVIITNQSGIGRGYFTEEQFLELMNWVKRRFLENEVTIDGVYFCPHNPEESGGSEQSGCVCRKPKPGLILRAIEELSLSAKDSVFIGDKESDMVAARAAGIPSCFLVGSEIKSEDFPVFPNLEELRGVIYGN